MRAGDREPPARISIMYFFYLDESGSRDPSVGTPEKPKDHIYVLLAVGMYERQWRPFEQEVSGLKLELADRLRREGIGAFDLADCEVKSNWLRRPDERQKRSPFLRALGRCDIQRLAEVYFEQMERRNAVIIATVIDKRYTCSNITSKELHQKAYEILLERLQFYMSTEHPKHQALIIMDDMDKVLNRSVAMQHAQFLHCGNQNMGFRSIVEYPFFTRSELSNGIQLADQLAYNVYHAFRYEDMGYSYFERLLPYFYRYQTQGQTVPIGISIWPGGSPLVDVTRAVWGLP